ncbi:hypothetical protein [Leptotrichia hongkongensis]|uniref:hypothetical protein n=1 Tax=Leptotrichia hongkongensis TaxID=554406 RepID=UPI0035A86630
MKKKLIILSLLVSALSMAADNKKGLVDSSKNHKNVEVNKNEDKKPQMGAPMNKKVITEDMITNKTENGYNLNFDVNKNYTTKTATVNGKTVTYRAYENIVYVAKPVDIAYQTINIYIPEEYFKNKSVGKYNAKSAPIFFPNTVGGYMPGAAGMPGNGSFKNQIKQYYIDSANTALKKGTDLSEFEFLTIKNGKVVDLDYDKYVAYMGRQKTPGAFDNVDLSTGENNEFGDETTNNKHFTEYMLEHSTVNGTMADKKIIKMMNPMNYIANSKVKYWRIRHGAVDKDTSLAIPAILAIKLENLGKKVDFASPWATPHSGDYDLDELFSWMDKVVAEGR